MNAELYAENHLFSPYSALRIIPFQAFTGLENMCIDYYLAKKCVRENRPIIRLYGWQPYCLSLGRHQKMTEVDWLACKKSGYDLVRRPTGGSAIFHSEEITYCLTVPGVRLDHQSIYREFHHILSKSLRRLGFPVTLEDQNVHYRLNEGPKTFACFNRAAFSELKFDGKKVVGSAQRVFPDALLQHGSILAGNKHLDIIRFLKASANEKSKYKSILLQNSISLFDIQNKYISVDELQESLIDTLNISADFPITQNALSEAELSEAIENRQRFDLQTYFN